MLRAQNWMSIYLSRTSTYNCDRAEPICIPDVPDLNQATKITLMEIQCYLQTFYFDELPADAHKNLQFSHQIHQPETPKS